MNLPRACASIIGAALVLDSVSAVAGPCTAAIAQFEEVVRQSARNPNAGPTARQSIGAQLGHQPTPGLVERAEDRAQTRFEAALGRAKTLDVQGKDAECIQALGEAKLMFDTK